LTGDDQKIDKKRAGLRVGEASSKPGLPGLSCLTTLCPQNQSSAAGGVWP